MAGRTASVTTGLRYVGITSSRSFAVVDVEAGVMEKLPSALPRSSPCDRVTVRDGWVALDVHSSLWAVSPGFDADPVPVVSTFRKVPCRDGVTMWVCPTEGSYKDRILAVDATSVIHAEYTLPEGWSTIEADTSGWMIVSRPSPGWPGSEIGAADDEDRVRPIAVAGRVISAQGAHVAWVGPDPRRPELRLARRLSVTDLTDGRTLDVDLPDIAEWHHAGRFSPDGSQFAIGGYLDPNPIWGMTESEKRAHFLHMSGAKAIARRRSAMAIIDVSTGVARVSDGTFDDFASAPLWAGDSRTVLFQPPFEDRRLYVVDVATMSMRAVAFRRSALTPLLLWNDDFPAGQADAPAAVPLAITEDPTFVAALEEAGLGRFASQIVTLDRMSFRLHGAGRIRADEPIGISRLGGRPDLAAEVAWPTWNGTPLAFVAQVALGSLPSLPDSPLPADGLLSFFYEAVSMPTGYDPAHRGGWRLIHQPDGASLHPREFPATLPEDATFDAIALTAAPELTHVPSESADLDTIALSRDQQWAYGDLVDHPDGLCHRLLGHPDAIQGDMQEQCQLVSHGLYCGDSSGYSDPRAAELRPGATKWRLVLQIDSDDDAGMNWVNDGRLYVFMTDEALAHHRWDEAWLVCQFT